MEGGGGRTYPADFELRVGDAVHDGACMFVCRVCLENEQALPPSLPPSLPPFPPSFLTK